MSFASPIFLWFFLPVVLAAYWILPCRSRNHLLVLASLLFYAWGGGAFLLLLLGYIGVNYAAGRALDGSAGEARRRRPDVLAAAVALDLAMLGVWKYASFALEQLDRLGGVLGTPRFAVPAITLPIGISFFTFHCISYVVDVARGRRAALRNLVDFSLYITMFPQLIAGPIVRFHEIADQLPPQRRNRLDDLANGFPRFALGLIKKVVIADAVGPVVDAVFGLPSSSLTTGTAWVGALAYAVQIYFDFSGYSDMAIGLARMFGFRFPENFSRPYSAVSITDFWRRWHMSLSRWFRDYLYIPLGGNRRGPAITCRNLLVVFVLTGLWHGANWTFLVWGLYHGGLLLIERATGADEPTVSSRTWRRASTFVLVVIGWVFFRAADLGHALEVLRVMVFPRAWALTSEVSAVLTSQRALALAVGLLTVLLPGDVVAGRLLDGQGRVPALARAAVVVVLPYAAVLVAAGTFSPFLYFRF